LSGVSAKLLKGSNPRPSCAVEDDRLQGFRCDVPKGREPGYGCAQVPEDLARSRRSVHSPQGVGHRPCARISWRPCP
jgi:hypothetical protein